MNMMNELMQQIEGLVNAKTFSLEALEGIKVIKDAAKVLDARLKKAEENYDAKCLEAAHLRDNEKRLQEECNKLHEVVLQLKEKEAAAARAIYESEKHKAVADAYLNAMSMVFKPSAVRETVQRHHTVAVPTMGGGGYTQSVMNQDHVVRSEE
jgi:hypothetical protein